MPRSAFSAASLLCSSTQAVTLLTLLFDEGLPAASLAAAFRALGINAWGVGEDGDGAPEDLPGRKSADDVNCEWCAAHRGVLVTNDWGRKDKAIFGALRKHKVSAVFINKNLRAAPLTELACALLRAERGIRDLSERKVPMARRLERNGKLVARDS